MICSQSQILKGNVIMKRVNLLFLIFVLLLSGCNIKPLSVFNKEKMADIIFDLHITESTIAMRKSSLKRVERQAYYNSVFAKYNTTKEAFDKSLAWYSRNPPKLEAVYAIVKEKQAEREALVNSYYYYPDEIVVIDSIRSIPLWLWQDSIYQREFLLTDSLHFKIDNKGWMEPQDEYVWRFIMTFLPNDSSTKANLEMVYQYTDSTIDTLRFPLRADSVKYRYTVTHAMENDKVPSSVEFKFIDLPDSTEISVLDIDSISFIRKYNYFNHPLSEVSVEQFEAYRDSLKLVGSKLNHDGNAVRLNIDKQKLQVPRSRDEFVKKSMKE